ncbi:UvrD-helicase domain-containing protein [Sphaerisporangium melleum]|uniref:UvrD-helicase domain-containing protein n=1 Tax=Sphaerisporangium melleum TaxID=321316 RepID=UPI00166E20B5|nr:UvrD-helicase domain-containing protein [Sphaerisporangium melleum]
MISPAELADKLGIPPPTPQQAAVIEAPLEPTVVVAGAGSGKSETMAGRVVWLVANGLVHPERVLGLTFTRKAAAELAARVRKRLTRLAEVGLAPAELLETEPTVSTYHSYAARLVTDHALREAMEPTMRLVSPAISWQMAARVVGRYDGPMDRIDLAPPSVTAAVLELAGELAEHLRTPGDVREVGHWLDERLARLTGRPTLVQRRPVRTQEIREQFLPLVEAYEREKRRREVIDYGDQMALAARIADRHPEVGVIERGRFSVVLLDEYQDTSHAQLVLLRALFGGGHPVTAVGDPCQSIYGWRGASSGNLRRFVHDFPTAAGRPAPVRRLSVSFRNGERVLDVAARVQGPLRAEAREVPVLVPGGNRVGRGRVICAFHETADGEAEWIAGEVVRLLGREVAPDGLPWGDGERDKLREKVKSSGPWGGPMALQPQDVAVLARKRSQFPALRRALEARGIPVEVVGLGGLLTVPEVADLVATLRVLYEPTAGDALARLLAGPRWRIGPADLKALGDLARELTATTRGGPAADDPLEQAVTDMREERGSLVDALDELADRSEWLERFSPLARARLPRLAHELRVLRAHAGQPLPDLISEIERRTGLDIEVAARGGGPLAARADLDAFLDAASRFAGDAEDPTLGAFLAYLKAAEAEEFGLEAGRVGETNSVKLMTVHASKGLEWPVVIVPGLSQITSRRGGPAKGSVFPATPATNSRWTENPRKLPYSLRGDRSDLPALAGLEKDDLAEFDERCRERDLMEERRLAYVAVTRAHYLLIASGYRWGSAARPLEPSDFLREVRDSGGQVAQWAPEMAEGAANPLLAEPASASWPVTPEGERQDAVRSGAALVFAALGHLSAAPAASGPPAAPPSSTAPGSSAAPASSAVPGSSAAPGPRSDASSVSVPMPPAAGQNGDVSRAAPFLDEPAQDAPFPDEAARDLPQAPAASLNGASWDDVPLPEPSWDDPGEAAWDEAPWDEVFADEALWDEATPADASRPEAFPQDATRDEMPARNAQEHRPSEEIPIAEAALKEWERERVRAWARDTELLLREREQGRRRGGGLVELPAHLTVSSLVTLAADPTALARQIRRPLPHRPAPLARRGTAFHRWLEGRWGQQRLIDDLELPGASDELSETDVRLAELQARFEESTWAALEPVDLEVPFETMIADRLVRGRMDAVFTEDDGYVVVDWKTGEPPRGRAGAAASVQLAAYRLAWARLAGVPLDKVGAAFHYVRLNQTVRPVDLLDAAGLVRLVESVPTDA